MVTTALVLSCAQKVTNPKHRTIWCTACSKDTTASVFLIPNQSTTPPVESQPQRLLAKSTKKLWKEPGTWLMALTLTMTASHAKSLLLTSIELATVILYFTMHSMIWSQLTGLWSGTIFKCMAVKLLPVSWGWSVVIVALKTFRGGTWCTLRQTPCLSTIVATWWPGTSKACSLWANPLLLI